MNFVETAVQSNLRDPSGLGPEGVLILEFAGCQKYNIFILLAEFKILLLLHVPFEIYSDSN